MSAYRCGCCAKVFRGYNSERDALYCCKSRKAKLIYVKAVEKELLRQEGLLRVDA